MAHVATINGVDVYSDKPVTHIVGTTVLFDDGSSCDVRTGTVQNKGPGYINFGEDGTDADSVSITNGPTLVQASALELQQISATVKVTTHDAAGIEYVITGPAKQVEAIRADVRDDTLVIDSDESGSSGTGMTINSPDGSVRIGGARGGTVITGGSMVLGSLGRRTSRFGRGSASTIIIGDGGSKVTVEVKVPRGTPVSANGVQGDVTIGDTDGSLTACLQSSHNLRAGRVASAQLTTQGGGSIDVAATNGTVTAIIQGGGDITVHGGTAPSLSATVQGSGDIDFRGTATTATLTVMGSGDIDVAHVVERPRKQIMGSGDISIRQVG